MRLKELLTDNYNAAEWEAKGYELPHFDIKAVRKNTYENPTWVHFGGGNIFRAFPAALLNDALNTGKYDRGVIVAETFDDEVIDKAYAPYDNLSLLVSLQSSGTIEKKVIASVTEALKGEDVEAVKKALDELSEKSQEIGKALYASGQTGTAQTSSASGASEDVVDAEIVDDEENKENK